MTAGEVMNAYSCTGVRHLDTDTIGGIDGYVSIELALVDVLNERTRVCMRNHR